MTNTKLIEVKLNYILNSKLDTCGNSILYFNTSTNKFELKNNIKILYFNTSTNKFELKNNIKYIYIAQLKQHLDTSDSNDIRNILEIYDTHDHMNNYLRFNILDEGGLIAAKEYLFKISKVLLHEADSNYGVKL